MNNSEQLNENYFYQYYFDVLKMNSQYADPNVMYELVCKEATNQSPNFTQTFDNYILKTLGIVLVMIKRVPLHSSMTREIEVANNITNFVNKYKEWYLANKIVTPNQNKWTTTTILASSMTYILEYLHEELFKLNDIETVVL